MSHKPGITVLPASIRDRHAGRNDDRASSTDVRDPSVFDHDDRVRERRVIRAVHDRRAEQRVRAGARGRDTLGQRLDIPETVADRSLHEDAELRGEILANRLEAQSAGARNRGDDAAVGVEPQRFTSPDDAVDRVAVKRQRALADAHRLTASLLDIHVVQRHAGDGLQHARTTVLLPVTDEHHLHGERRVAIDGEERRGQGDAPLGVIRADDRIRALHANVGIDVDEPIALAFGAERLRAEIGAHLQRRLQLHSSATIGEVDIRGQLDAPAVARQRVVLFADRFLNVVQHQGPVLA